MDPGAAREPVLGGARRTGSAVATFNVRTWSADGRKGTSRFNWNMRGDNVITEILRSGAHALAIQEASGPAGVGFGARDQNAWILNRLNAMRQRSGARWVDALTDDDYRGKGLIGTRVFYDATRFTKLGVRALPHQGPAGRRRAAPLGEAAGGRPRPGAVRADVDPPRRRREAGRLRHPRPPGAAGDRRTCASSSRPTAGRSSWRGDLNSTANTEPYNNVQRALLGAGLYDSFATTRIAHAAVQHHERLQLPGPADAGTARLHHDLGPVQGSCAYVNQAYRQASKVASDHFLQVRHPAARTAVTPRTAR